MSTQDHATLSSAMSTQDQPNAINNETISHAPNPSTTKPQNIFEKFSNPFEALALPPPISQPDSQDEVGIESYVVTQGPDNAVIHEALQTDLEMGDARGLDVFGTEHNMVMLPDANEGFGRRSGSPFSGTSVTASQSEIESGAQRAQDATHDAIQDAAMDQTSSHMSSLQDMNMTSAPQSTTPAFPPSPTLTNQSSSYSSIERTPSPCPYIYDEEEEYPMPDESFFHPSNTIPHITLPNLITQPSDLDNFFRHHKEAQYRKAWTDWISKSVPKKKETNSLHQKAKRQEEKAHLKFPLAPTATHASPSQGLESKTAFQALVIPSQSLDTGFRRSEKRTPGSGTVGPFCEPSNHLLKCGHHHDPENVFLGCGANCYGSGYIGCVPMWAYECAECEGQDSCGEEVPMWSEEEWEASLNMDFGA